MSEEKTVIISETEYKQLRKDSDLLNALEQCGVDNWDGYGDALKLVEEWKKKDKQEQENVL